MRFVRKKMITRSFRLSIRYRRSVTFTTDISVSPRPTFFFCTHCGAGVIGLPASAKSREQDDMDGPVLALETWVPFLYPNAGACVVRKWFASSGGIRLFEK